MSSSPRQRVILVSEVFPPDIAGSGVTAATVATGLAERYDVTVITGAPDFTGEGVAAPRRERWCGMDIVRCKTFGLGKNHFGDRSLRAAVVGSTLTAAVVRHVRPGDVVLVVVAPGLLGWAAVQAARARRAKVALLVYDIFPENLVPAGVVPARSPILWSLQRLYHPLYRQVDVIVVLGRCMADRVRQLGGSRCAPITITHHWADLDDVRPLADDETSLRAQFGIDPERFVFLFAGNLGRVQGLDMVAAAMAQLRGDDRLVALFVGAGAGKDKIEAAITRYDLDNVMLQPMLPRDMQRRLLGTADVGLVTLCEDMLGLGVPGKTPNLLAAGKPILAVMHPQAETSRLLAEERVG